MSGSPSAWGGRYNLGGDKDESPSHTSKSGYLVEDLSRNICSYVVQMIHG